MFSGYKFFTHLVGKGFLLAWGLSFGSLTVFSFDEVLLMLFLSPFCVMLWVSKPFVYDSEVFLIFFQNFFSRRCLMLCFIISSVMNFHLIFV